MAKGKKAKAKKQERETVEEAFAVPVMPGAVPELSSLDDAAPLAPRRLLDRLSGAKLCYGKPVRGGDLTVIPVARVRVAGGFSGGGGRGDAGETGYGQGGGGSLDASPVGYIEVGPSGALFRPIADPDRALRTARSLAVTAAGLLGAAAALRSLTR